MRNAKIATALLFAMALDWRMIAADLPSGSGGVPTLRKERINLETYDFAKVGSKTLTRAEDIASGIFALAAVDTGWKTGQVSEASRVGSDFSAGNHQLCAAPLRSATVLVQFLPRAPRQFSPGALGYALPCAQFGMQVTIYMDRVEAVSAGTAAGCDRVLGHVLAHEVGHVLLRSSEHGDRGLLKGVWTKLDWQRAAVVLVPFSKGEGERMTAELRKIHSD